MLETFQGNSSMKCLSSIIVSQQGYSTMQKQERERRWVWVFSFKTELGFVTVLFMQKQQQLQIFADTILPLATVEQAKRKNGCSTVKSRRGKKAKWLAGELSLKKETI